MTAFIITHHFIFFVFCFLEEIFIHTHTHYVLHMHYLPCDIKDSSSTKFALRSTLFREQTVRLLEPAEKKTGETSEGGLVT